jgi:hypothetical protein
MSAGSTKPKAFVIMPFDKEFDDIYKALINPALEAAGYAVFRADDLLSHNNILRDIVSSIISSQLIVADLTGANPNVFYEVGLAHALKKRVVLLTQDVSEVPFDLRSYRMVQYDTHFARVENAQNQLIELAKGAIDGTVQFGSPITDFLGLEVAPAADMQPMAGVQAFDTAVSAEQRAPRNDRGFLDHLADVEEGFSELTGLIQAVSSATKDISGETGQKTGEMEAAAGRQTAGTASHLRKLARALAGKLSDYTGTLTGVNEKYHEISRNTENSLEFVVSYNEPDSESDLQKLREFLDTMAEVEGSSVEGRQAFLRLADTMETLPNIQRHLDRARLLCAVELRRLAANIERTIASVRRAREVAEVKLQHASSSE